jgi:hypothetical protein
MNRRLPSELSVGEAQHIGLLADEVAAIERAKEALVDDLRFEHLRSVDDDVWYFVGECWVDRGTDHVPAFIERHAREPMDLVCYSPVEFLSVSSETEALGVHLLPLDDPRIPETGRRFKLEQPVGCVVAVDVRGTNYERMAERARAVASHTLRVLRIALREHLAIHDRQLRFRLGIAYAFADGGSGWKQREDAAYELEFGGELIDLVRSQPISTMSIEPSTDIEKKADLAMRWMERGWLAGEPLVALLYLFFALEALLGDTSEKLKAHGLAFRQAMLSGIVTGSFTHPNQTWFLYDEVRSGAVHGEDVAEVSWDVVQSFAWDVRRALNHYLTLARERGIGKRGRLLKVLDEHPDRPHLIAWLRQNGGCTWTRYLDKIDRAS